MVYAGSPAPSVLFSTPEGGVAPMIFDKDLVTLSSNLFVTSSACNGGGDRAKIKDFRRAAASEQGEFQLRV